MTVTLEDYKPLQVGTFLNDTIIDFYLKQRQYTEFSQLDRDRTHIFTTFWFSRYCTHSTGTQCYQLQIHVLYISYPYCSAAK